MALSLVKSMNGPGLPKPPTTAPSTGTSFGKHSAEPVPAICEHCHAEMRYRWVPILDSGWWVPPAPCSCPGAQTDRAKRREEEQREELDQRARERERLLTQSGLPVRYHGATFAAAVVTDTTRTAFARVREFADRPAGGLLISGPVGTGKTYLAAAAVNHWLDQLRRVTFGGVVQLLGRIRNSYGDSSRETEWEIIDQLTSVPVLVLDDLGKEKVTEWVEQTLYQVVDTRYREERPVVITTNFPFPDMQDRYPDVGPALVSRLVEMCQGIRLDGPDWRYRRFDSFA